MTGTMLKVNGVYVKDPSQMSWGITDITAADNGRTEDGTYHKNMVAKKRMLSLGWNYPTPEETSQILKAFNPVYVEVTYHDTLDNEIQTRTFYVDSDMNAPVKIWTVDNKRYSSITIDLMER